MGFTYTTSSVFYDEVKNKIIIGAWGECTGVNTKRRIVRFRSYSYLGEL